MKMVSVRKPNSVWNAKFGEQSRKRINLFFYSCTVIVLPDCCLSLDGPLEQ